MRVIKIIVTSLLILAIYGQAARAEVGDHPVNGPYASAVRLNDQVQHEAPPPPPRLWTTESANGKCIGLIAALTYWSPGWDVNRMAGIAYRESRCDPSASNSCCSGVLQMHKIHVPEPWCGVYSRNDLYDPWKNICSAAALWRSSGYGAWSTS